MMWRDKAQSGTIRQGVAMALRSAILLLGCLSPLAAAAGSGTDFPALSLARVDTVPFTLAAARDPSGRLLLRWTIEPGTYLYRDSLKAMLEGRNVTLALPEGEAKDDPNFGIVRVFHADVEATAGNLAGSGDLRVGYQGCSEKGICYPPQADIVDLSSLAVRSAPTGFGPAGDAETTAQPSSAPPGGEHGAEALFRGGTGWSMLAFLGFGLLLSLTPCIFPMIPILAGMLTRSGETLTLRRALALTGAYVLAMATAYALVGAVAGWSGANLQVALQTPLALGMTAAIFVALALSMFGVFDLALATALANRLSGRASGGSLGGAALLGFGSALIVGPCVTPPLAGALLYAATTGDAAMGAGALFMLGLGMGLPLLLVGVFGPRILPRSGLWLERAKQAFGVVFLAIAVLLAGRLMPPPATLAMLGALLIGSTAFFGGFDRLGSASMPVARLVHAGGIVAGIYGAALIVGAAAGADDPLRPLAFASTAPILRSKGEAGVTVASPADFDRAIASARAATPGRPLLVEFTADWCTVCKSNAKVMAAPEIVSRLAALGRVTADITTYDAPTRELLQRFRLVGPPALLLLGADGREIPGSRLVGPVTAEEINRRLDAAI